MLKKRARIITIMQRIADLSAVFLAWVLAYLIRFRLIPGGQPGIFPELLKLTPYLLVITLFFHTRNNLYHSTRYISWYKEVGRIAKSNVQSISAFFILLYMTSQVRFSRVTLILYAGLVIGISVIFRLIVRSQLWKLRKSGKNFRQIVLVGNSSRMVEYIRTLRLLPQAGIHVTGWIDSEGLAEKHKVPELTFQDLDKEDRDLPDMVMIGYAAHKYKEIDEAVNFCNQRFMEAMLIPNIQYDYLGYEMLEFEGIPLISINAPGISLLGMIMKRVLDILGSAAGLILLSPLFLILAVLVKLSSRGPVFYGQERMSLDGKTFKMWKFRSMKLDAEESSGAVWAVKNDDRTTKIGSLLRKTSLDELPQLWNVFIGNMSLVGPRPERPVFIDKFKDQIPSYMLRHRVKSGMTGWAQINGWRGNTSIEKRLEFDLYYIKHWSLPFDLAILFLTIIRGFVNQNAY